MYFHGHGGNVKFLFHLLRFLSQASFLRAGNRQFATVPFPHCHDSSRNDVCSADFRSSLLPQTHSYAFQTFCLPHRCIHLDRGCGAYAVFACRNRLHPKRQLRCFHARHPRLASDSVWVGIGLRYRRYGICAAQHIRRRVRRGRTVLRSTHRRGILRFDQLS